jgi:hypothetical protein
VQKAINHVFSLCFYSNGMLLIEDYLLTEICCFGYETIAVWVGHNLPATNGAQELMADTLAYLAKKADVQCQW